MIFEKAPRPKTKNEQDTVQQSLMNHEVEEHQMIEIQKKTEIMQKYKNDNMFILSTLEERCNDYKQAISEYESAQNLGSQGIYSLF